MTIPVLLGICLCSPDRSNRMTRPIQRCKGTPVEASRERLSRNARGLRGRSHPLVCLLRVLFSFSLGLVFLALLPITLLLGRTSQFVKQLTPFIVLLMSYEALQGVAGSLSLAPVIHRASSGAPYGIIEAVQSAFLSPDLTDAMSLFYGLHFPLVIGSAILLWYSNRGLYKRYVYSLVACSYVSLVFYTLAPSAPPW